jgi:hypothetical protein
LPIPHGLQTVNDILTKPNWDFGQLVEAARTRARATFATLATMPGKAFGVPNCATSYGAGNHEVDAWLLCILIGEYVAGLLAQKAVEGHCQQHRKMPDFTPCPEMAKEHLRMLGGFRDSLSTLVREIEDLEKQTLAKLPQPPAP